MLYSITVIAKILTKTMVSSFSQINQKMMKSALMKDLYYEIERLKQGLTPLSLLIFSMLVAILLYTYVCQEKRVRHFIETSYAYS